MSYPLRLILCDRIRLEFQVGEILRRELIYIQLGSGWILFPRYAILSA